jgi:uncharacterized membrane protein
MKKIIFFWSKLISTFWFIPAFIILIAIVMALSFVYLDGVVSVSREGTGRFLFVNSTESARNILTTISSAMIGVAGTVFSITIVVLTLASSQLGPRLIRNFMYERINQFVLGSYVSTYIFCLIVLNAINEHEGMVFIPSMSVLVALIAALVNIILLIVFIHHIAVSIQADTVISNIADVMSKNLKNLFPQSLGKEIEDIKEEDADSIIKQYDFKHSLKANKGGYLQYIDSDSLLKLSVELDVVIKLHNRPGNFLVKDIEICTIYSKRKFESTDFEKLQSHIITGNRRTHQQDAEYSIHQLVEIAARALSPGVNDPFTAITCIKFLTSTMGYLAQKKLPSRYRFDKNDHLRVIASVLSFEGMLDAAFNQIRQFSKDNPAVVISMMEALVTISRFAERDTCKNAIEKHARMILKMAEETFSEPNDLKDLKERSKLLFSKKTDEAGSFVDV